LGHDQADVHRRLSRVTALIVDTDTGIDDALALAFIAASPELDLRLVTSCFGNAAAEHTARNARHVLDLWDAPGVPVVQGPRAPLFKAVALSAIVHGSSGLGGATVPDEARPVPGLDVAPFITESAA
jgi:inosine-uridine nucleoside N-ribohydrolase